MGEQHSSWKSVVVIAAAYLAVSAIVIVTIFLWPWQEGTTPENQGASPPVRYITEKEPAPDDVTYWLDLSPELLETVSLEAVRAYMPAAASLVPVDPAGEFNGNYGIRDAGGAELGMVVLDHDGKISSDRIYIIGPETAKGIAVGMIVEAGIDPALVLLEHDYISHASEHVTQYYFIYRPHIGDVPVFNQDSCAVTLNASDGSAMFFSLNGSFVLPDAGPSGTLVSEKEAVMLALGEFRSWAEGSYMAQGAQEALSIDYAVTGPVDFVYSQQASMDGSIVPLWKIPVARYVTRLDENGAPVTFNSDGGCMCEVNATTGAVLLAGRW